MTETAKDVAVVDEGNDTKVFTQYPKKGEAVPVAEDIYTTEEFAQRPEMFGDGVRNYTVLAAFRYAGKDTATKTEAQEIVARFRDKKVGE